MENLLKRSKKHPLSRYLAWLLIVVTLVTNGLPTQLITAAKSSNWDVDYVLGIVEDESHFPIDSEGELAVSACNIVNLGLSIDLTSEATNHRFKEEFKITMPVELASMSNCLEVGTTLGDAVGFDREVFVVSDVAYASDSNTSSPSGTTATLHKTTMAEDSCEITLKFVDDLYQANSSDIQETYYFDYVEAVISFDIEENVALELIQNGNDSRILMTTAPPQVGTSRYWDTTWVMKVNGEEKTTGDDIPIVKDDIVTFDLLLALKDDYYSMTNDREARYQDQFLISMPKEMWEKTKDQIRWPTFHGQPVFEEVVWEDGYLLLSFADFSNLSGMYYLEETDFGFSFTADEKINITYQYNEENTSYDIVCKETPKEEPKYKVSKSVTAVFNETGCQTAGTVANSKFVASSSDYVLYRMNLKGSNLKEGIEYQVATSSVYDYFDASVYEYIDLTSAGPETLFSEAIQALLPADVLEILNGNAGEISWLNIAKADWPKEISQKGNYSVYANANAVTLTSENPAADFYICLKVKPNSGQEYTKTNLLNYVYESGGKSSSNVGPYPGGFYDYALKIVPTTVYHTNDTNENVTPSSKAMTTGKEASVSFAGPNTGILDNAKAGVSPGDFVTFRIQTYDQGSKKANVNAISIYIPQGLELVTSTSVLPANYKFTTSTTLTTSPSKAPTEANKHVFPTTPGDQVIFPASLAGDLDATAAAYYGSVTRYTYEFSAAKYNPEIFITCKVKDLSKVYGSVSNLEEAARYGYLLTAEVSKISDVTDTANKAVTDDDSWVDNDPFNDWAVTESNSELKNKALYYYESSALGEKDNTTDQHVRTLGGNYTYTYDYKYKTRDEDDFDYAILPVYKTQEKSIDDIISKGIADSGSKYYKKAEELLDSIGKKSSLLGHSNSGTVGTIVPYVVYINGDGSRKLDDVTFWDDLPDTMSFLTYQTAGGEEKPYVSIYERIENDNRRYEYEVGDTRVSVIEINDSSEYIAKHWNSDEYIAAVNAAGERISFQPKKGTGDPAQWETVVTTEDSKQRLTIPFGDIYDKMDDNSCGNAYAILYLAVVDQIDASYVNDATIKWSEDQKSTSLDYTLDSYASTKGYSKSVSLTEDGDYTLLPVEVTEVGSDGLDIYYKLGISLTPKENLTARTASYTDNIDDLFGGSRPDNVEVEILSIEDNVSQGEAKDYEPFHASSIKTNHGVVVKIENQKPLKANVSSSCLVTLKVHYKEVPSGITIENSFASDTTQVLVPLRLELTKKDAADGALLRDASFQLSYDEAGTKLLSNMTTDAHGEAVANFYLDEDYYNSDDECYYLYLSEKTAPNGYYELGGIDKNPDVPYVIKLKVTQDADGHYAYETMYHESEEADSAYYTVDHEASEIAIVVKNYIKPVNVDLELMKKLLNVSDDAAEDGKELAFEAGAYNFTVSLKECRDGGEASAVTFPDAGNYLKVSNDADGMIRFKGIKISKIGTYIFQAKELPQIVDGKILSGYDPGTITITVRVMKKGDHLEAVVTEWLKTEPAGSETHFYGRDGYHESAADKDKMFVNFSSSTPSSDTVVINLEAGKHLIGRTLTKDAFEFQAKMVYASNQVMMDVIETKNDADGTIVFPALEFGETGTYIFELSEVVDGLTADHDINYDHAKYYAQIEVTERRDGSMAVKEVYGVKYDDSTHTVSGKFTSDQKPIFVNAVKGYLNLKKVAYSDGRALTGAQFELSYRPLGSDATWTVLKSGLETSGTDGSLRFELPEYYSDYEYQLTETKAPAGYSKSKVGVITFVMSVDGTVASWSTTGTQGYILLSDDNTIFTVKNDKTSRGGSGGSGGSGGGTTTIPDGNTPLGGMDGSTSLEQLTTFIEEMAVPLAELAKTGDFGIPLAVLGVIMLASVTGFGIVAYRRKRKCR